MISEAVEAIRSGEVVGLPTDTVYGIGVDPLNADAVEKLFVIKGRPEHKPIGLLVATLEQARTIGEITERALELARRHWPGALTLVVPPKVVLARWVGDAQAQSVGIRIPDHPTALELLTATGPLAVTSANRSGGRELMDDVAAQAEFADEVAVYVEGVSPGGEASTVVDATTAQLSVLRPGPVTV